MPATSDSPPPTPWLPSAWFPSFQILSELSFAVERNLEELGSSELGSSPRGSWGDLGPQRALGEPQAEQEGGTSLQPPVWLGWSRLVPLGLGFSGELVCFLKNSCGKHVGKCLRISVMAEERTLLPAACWWPGSLGRDLGPACQALQVNV